MKKTAMIILMSILLCLNVSALTVFAEENQEKREIIYEIIVDRFNNIDHTIDEKVNLENPNTYHGGDMQGIIEKLDDLANIGVSTIALSPIMANAEDGYHGYWIEDFKKVEESFGTMDDLNELVTQAHERDMKVVLEFVTNYISNQHPIAVESGKEDWVLTKEVEGPAWTDGVIQLNQDNLEVQEFLIDAAEFWLEETEIDGFVLHAVDQSSIEFLQSFTTNLKDTYKDIYLYGDILLDPEAVDEIQENVELDAIDNYSLSETIAEVFSELNQPVEKIYEESLSAVENSNLVFVDDKYSERFTQKFSENGRNSLTAWKMALTYLYTTPDTPVILQGTEVGMYGETAEDSQRLVPFTSGDPDLIEFHERLSSLVNEFPALKYGDIELVGSSGAMSVFKRTYEDQTMYIAINNGSESAYVDLTDVGPDMMLRGYLEDNLARANEEGNYRIGIPRESVEVYQLMDDVGYNWVLIGFAGAVILTFVLAIIRLQRKQKERESQG